MSQQVLCDIFITHAWRYHDDWTRLTEVLDAAAGTAWRNFSVPWHDPAMDPNSEVGGRFIRSWLESQIIPVHAVLLLAGVYAVKSSRKWIDLEIEFARQHHKPVIAIPPVDATQIPGEVVGLCDATVTWDGAAIMQAVARLTSKQQV